MSSKSSSSNSGMGCGGVLQVIFIVLKLLNLIDWSWWWVMSPTLITIGIVLFFFSLAFIAAVMRD